MEIEVTVTVGRPVAEVFNFSTNPANWALWEAGLQEARLVAGESMEQGSKIQMKLNLLGKQLVGVHEVVAFEKERLTRVKATHPFRTEVEHRFEPVHAGTKVTRRICAEPEGIFRLAIPVLERMTRRNMENFKRVVEEQR